MESTGGYFPLPLTTTIYNDRDVRFTYDRDYKGDDVAHHKMRVGTHIVRSLGLNEDLKETIEKSKSMPRRGWINKMVITHYNEMANLCTIQVWAQNVKLSNKNAEIVFNVKLPPNMDWVCEIHSI